ncbi:MAG: hypothetical protein V7637_4029 [Mycobacteriales bacterium]
MLCAVTATRKESVGRKMNVLIVHYEYRTKFSH